MKITWSFKCKFESRKKLESTGNFMLNYIIYLIGLYCSVPYGRFYINVSITISH